MITRPPAYLGDPSENPQGEPFVSRPFLVKGIALQAGVSEATVYWVRTTAAGSVSIRRNACPKRLVSWGGRSARERPLAGCEPMSARGAFGPDLSERDRTEDPPDPCRANGSFPHSLVSNAVLLLPGHQGPFRFVPSAATGPISSAYDAD